MAVELKVRADVITRSEPEARSDPCANGRRNIQNQSAVTGGCGSGSIAPIIYALKITTSFVPAVFSEVLGK